MTLMTNLIPNLALNAIDGFQCFPFYVYDEDGSNRRENITDWALGEFRARYGELPSPPAPSPCAGEGSEMRGSSPSPAAVGKGWRDSDGVRADRDSDGVRELTKWDIFHYIYGLLHSPDYRSRYAANLKRDLPRIPFVATADFWRFVQAGRRLAEIYIGYEHAAPYPLTHVENPNVKWTWRVEKMKLNKDKTALMYNEALTLDGIPAAAFGYRLGNRSALEWVIDQYQESVDKRSGIGSDPNNADDPQAIVRLVKQVIAVSVETVQIVAELPALVVAE